jgi:hypothetical protein
LHRIAFPVVSNGVRTLALAVVLLLPSTMHPGRQLSPQRRDRRAAKEALNENATPVGISMEGIEPETARWL